MYLLSFFIIIDSGNVAYTNYKYKQWACLHKPVLGWRRKQNKHIHYALNTQISLEPLKNKTLVLIIYQSNTKLQ